MRILQVHTSDQGGGAELIALNLHRDFNRAGHESTLLVGKKKTTFPGVIEIPQVQRFPGEFRLKNRLKQSLGLQYVYGPGSFSVMNLAPWKPEVMVLHSLHGANGYFNLGALPAFSGSLPTFLVLHDQWLLSGHCAYTLDCNRWKTGCGKCPDLVRSPAIEKDGTRLNWLRKKWIYGRSTLTLIPTAKWLNECLDVSPLLKDKPRHVIYNSVDTEVFTPGSKAAARKALGLPLDKPLLLFLANKGASAIFKDFNTLARALHLVRAQRPDCMLVTVGGIPSKEVTESLPDDTFFMPYETDRAAIANFYRAADVFCHATKADVCPLTVLESQACGTPVIATRVGGIPEIVEDGQTGILVRAGDAEGFAAAIRSLLDFPRWQKVMGDQAVELVKRRFTPATQVGAYERVFQPA